MRYFIMFFSKLRNKNISKIAIQIFAPLSGTILSISKVPDKVFSKKIVGDGIAIKPIDSVIVSPVDGIIGKIFRTNHAFSIVSHDGIELFVHLGIDTVNLKGKGFKRILNDGESVNIGDPIIEIDLNFILKNAKSIITPVIISNIEKFHEIKKYSGTVLAGKTPILDVFK
ncbi:PTS glucose transporter subunit IIA [Candidatus Purcelliella pentastirinorum]|nr:PTS glucose transporter subunit IIA [Candidatus Purcelliella pentastirinorum]WDR80376.1 PTS glucose transporter subunit IIA [Candidatus Purcelliella pentastirinorum]